MTATITLKAQEIVPGVRKQKPKPGRACPRCREKMSMYNPAKVCWPCQSSKSTPGRADTKTRTYNSDTRWCSRKGHDTHKYGRDLRTKNCVQCTREDQRDRRVEKKKGNARVPTFVELPYLQSIVEAQGLTCAELARRTGIATESVRWVLMREGRTRVSKAQKLAEAVGIKSYKSLMAEEE